MTIDNIPDAVVRLCRVTTTGAAGAFHGPRGVARGGRTTARSRRARRSRGPRTGSLHTGDAAETPARATASSSPQPISAAELLGHADRLFGLAAHLTGSRAAEEDLVQETYVRALRADVPAVPTATFGTAGGRSDGPVATSLSLEAS